MMKLSVLASLLLCLFVTTQVRADESSQILVSGLVNPESVTIGADGRVYVSVIGEFGKDGDGAIMVVEDGQAKPFATGLDDPKGLVAFMGMLFVADKQHVMMVDPSGSVKRFVPANAFPSTPRFLNDLALDAESGTLYASDSGDLEGHGGVVYRISPRGLVDIVLDVSLCPGLHTPNGLLLDGASHLLVGDFGTGTLYRVKLATRTVEKLADGLGGIDGLAWDQHGQLFSTDWKDGRLFGVARPGGTWVQLAEQLQSAADLCLDTAASRLLVPDMKAGTVHAIRTSIPGAEIDESPLNVETALAFPKLEWADWKSEDDDGKIVPLRPIVLTHAGDGSNRVFVATQQGVVHVFANKADAKRTEVFLDLQDRVRYIDQENEEGLLGLAFHPQFKKNGELFVFYTPKEAEAPHVNVVSRFRLQDDSKQLDPASEEVLLRVEHPFWNHDGGTICFGPDGFLYVALGDGGFANDLYANGQNPGTLLGSILRLDVDHRDGDLPYAIPKDNPFVAKEGVRPETWVYGLRNVWRFSFDRKTGIGWAADVGQNLWEEINLLAPGANYGWNLREGLHPFGALGSGPTASLTDPIWEYHHDTGKSITGGFVYRGKKMAELAGMYVYADYVSGRLWALQYDATQKRVVANRPISSPKLPVLSFGEDEQGEVYFLVASPTGEGIYTFKKPSAKQP